MRSRLRRRRREREEGNLGSVLGYGGGAVGLRAITMGPGPAGGSLWSLDQIAAYGPT